MRSILSLAMVLVLSSRVLGGDFQAGDIVGTWNGKAKDGYAITYSFRKDGTMLWVTDDPIFRPQYPEGLKARYALKQKGALWEIDMYDLAGTNLKEVKILGILQPMSDRKFKIDCKPSNEGQRPTTFGEDSVEFSKSDR